MPFMELTCRAGGSNLNAGTLNGSDEASASPLVVWASGTYTNNTDVNGSVTASQARFQPAGGNPVSAGVQVGHHVSMYADGAAGPTAYVARVAAVSSTAISVVNSGSGWLGTRPTTGGGITCAVGGAWLGPSGAVGFPFNFITSSLANSSGRPPRVNLKNNQTYAITAGISHANTITWFEGYTSAFGDGGIATIDAGGNAIPILTMAGSSQVVASIRVRNNSGDNTGLVMGGRSQAFRCIAETVGGNGISSFGALSECEAYGCNLSGTAGRAGIAAAGLSVMRCISHGNAGTQTDGLLASGSVVLEECVAFGNGRHGIRYNSNNNFVVKRCDAYGNGGDGLFLEVSTSTQPQYVESCNFVGNGGYGIRVTNNAIGLVLSCGFGSGSRANTAGRTLFPATSPFDERGSVTYPAGGTPWADPDNGDFRITLPQAKGAGRGAFLQTAPGYGGTIGYPDLGAAQHQDSGGGGGAFIVSGF